MGSAFHAVFFSNQGGVIDAFETTSMSSAGDVGEMKVGDEIGSGLGAFPLAEVAIEKEIFKIFHAR